MKTSILKEGQNCWKIAATNRFAVLVDAASFYRAFVKVAEQAKESILILAWDIDWRTRLTEDSTETFAEFLLRLVKKSKRLHIHILEWDFAMIYAVERGILPMFGVGMPRHRRIHYRRDDKHPLAGSHHQKIVVIDDQIAFCGGLDITRQRWDTPEHRPHDVRRIDPDGIVYAPFHDVQVMCDCEAARCLADIARARWKKATSKDLRTPSMFQHLWPSEVQPDFTNCRVGISRTEPPYNGDTGIHEIENLFVDMVKTAKRWLYIEAQYLTSAGFEKALEESLSQSEGPEILIVVPRDCSGWLEENTMGGLRCRMLQQLNEVDHHKRLRVCYPVNEQTPVLVHSKIIVADDCAVTIGSANLSNRSMGLDTECNLTIQSDGSSRIENAIGRIRNRLLGEHLGMSAEDVQTALKATGSINELIDFRKGSPRYLKIVETKEFEASSSLLTDRDIVDPERPIDLEGWVNDFVFEEEEKRHISNDVLWTGIFLALIILLTASWYWTPLRNLVDPKFLAERAAAAKDFPHSVLVVTASYLLGSLILFPITILMLATIFLYGPVWGFGYSLFGSVLAAAFTYVIGRKLARNRVRQLAGNKLNRISKLIAKKGLLTIVIARMLPIAPFSIVNVVAGASHIRFLDFILGTAIGMLPGLIGMTLFGNSLKSAVRDPDPISILILIFVIGSLLFLAAMIKKRLGARENSMKADISNASS
ncbi:MAG TPA: VTT domain-containing protein [Acidobacteriota bacterium]|nr:VTT domain-containing protein [Acidobacteriota bacterium]